MAKPKEGAIMNAFSNKKEGDDIPVAPCQGWTDACDFCDKRFGTWVDANDEELAKVPTKPGIFKVGLKNKSTVEVVDIVLSTDDLQKVAFTCIDHAKDRVADKKSKSTKSVVVCRWMTFKHTNDKDVTNLCAHWYNNGVLPKFLSAWPGLEILQKSDNLVFSDTLQKWCYPKKDAFWRKPKGPPTKLVEEVESCDWMQDCEICDNYFSEWKRLENVVQNELAPDSTGICTVAVRYGKIREVVDVIFNAETIKLNSIKESLDKYDKRYLLRNKKFAGKNPVLEVRWAEFSDPENDNCCFLYAHWLNAASVPMICFKLPGQRIVERNKHFVIRTRDNKWCYEIDVFKQMKTTKSKNKKHILNDLEEDMRYLSVEDE